jgi:hypothetical protein
MNTGIKFPDNKALEISEIRETSDYSRFKLLQWNRGVELHRVMKLMQSMKRYGFLLPILVNQNGRIADGQHRFEAAKSLGLGVRYIVFELEDDLLPLLVSNVNSLAKTWRLIDYQNCWAEFGKAPYLWVKRLAEDRGVELDTLVRFIINTTSTHEANQDKFKNGEFYPTDKDKERIEERIVQANQIFMINKKFHEFKNRKMFYSAVLRIVTAKNYNHKRMVDKLNRDSDTIIRAHRRQDYIKQLEELYNKNLQADNFVRF